MKTSKSVLKDDSLVTIYRSTLLRNTAGIFYSSQIDFNYDNRYKWISAFFAPFNP